MMTKSVRLNQQVANHYDMTPGRSVKAGKPSRSLVAVIASGADLQRATRLRRLPDFCELRLDALHPLLPALGEEISKLNPPLIITARHPLEGGFNNLSASERRRLHLCFAQKAAWIDVELRSAEQLARVLDTAQERGSKRIISVHDLKRTPSASTLSRLLERAQKFSPDVFKIVTRTETPDELSRLLAFFETYKQEVPISAMGIGKLGRESRLVFMQRGSVLNYAHLGDHLIEGQIHLRQLQRWTAKSNSIPANPRTAARRISS